MERNFDITESFSSIADYSDKIPNSIMAQYADGQTSISFHSGAERKIGNYKWFVFKWGSVDIWACKIVKSYILLLNGNIRLLLSKVGSLFINCMLENLEI